MLLHSGFDSKKIAYDPGTSGTTHWTASTRTARIVKVEPPDASAIRLR